MVSATLDLRELNRATLARQGLLERRGGGVADMVRAVGGLQAQLPGAPVIGLWSRMSAFTRDELHAAIAAGEVVRGTTLRGTIHLHHVDDYRVLRPTLDPLMEAFTRSQTLRRVREQDRDAAIEAAHALMRSGSVTVGELKAHLVERFPESGAQGLAVMARMALRILLVPDPAATDGWKPNAAPLALATDLVGDTFGDPDVEWLVRRWFEVLGPGTVKDVQTWSSMRRLKPIVDSMRDNGELVAVTTWEGDELLDLPGAARPDAEVVAPPRFLPMWDNLPLSHADRSRVIDPAHRPFLAVKNGMPPPTFLLDGFVAGTWKVEREGGTTVLVLTPFGRIPRAHEDALVAEGDSLLAFLHPGAASRRVRVG
ncbi:MAG: hypothetical protein JWL76_1846 [Thermoleophilia bacterium]|nr:hypothetical protein [Thermoleophilia bacterium]